MRCEVVSKAANSLTKQKYFRLYTPMVDQQKKKYQCPSSENLSARQKLSYWKLNIFCVSLEKLQFMPVIEQQFSREVITACGSTCMFYVCSGLESLGICCQCYKAVRCSPCICKRRLAGPNASSPSY